ncbi:hypothetical protein F4556_001316 [Kitasatospora gansuensis]|uniref:DUF3592 domain-containing protein n=1 Tax=Kitasatospora gansuensis TaxID=258050 RepID=A0A7W7WG21_9ACTN|nr:DUF3592 domain-containing protein [Kitasatospora gansuensis]MBB4945781.1 hypothetical protein [Kitasatospora gansuensis]
MSEEKPPKDGGNGATAEIVLRGSRGRSARFVDGWVVIEQRDVVHRIPVAAIDRVVAGSGRVEVVLRAASGPARIHRIRHRGSGEAFVRVVTKALPVLDAAERAGDGGALVESAVLAKSSGGPGRLLRPVNSPLKVFGWLYLAGFGPAFSTPGHRMAGSLLLWVFGPPCLGLAVLGVVGAVRSLPKPWALHRRGITVVATVTGHEREVDQVGDEAPSNRYYAIYEFVDADGVTRTHTARDQEGLVSGGRGEICYDPADPAVIRRAANFGARVYWSVAGIVLILLPMVLVGLAMSVGAMVIAYRFAE